MRVIFRVDASTEMGSGHVMRCLTLADRLKAEGAGVTFIFRELPGNLGGVIDSRGFDVLCLPAPVAVGQALPHPPRHAQWLGVDWRVDAEQTAAGLAQAPGASDWLIVDHYALDREWENWMRPHALRIMVIDDLGDRSHECDMLLDQNLHKNLENRYDGLLPARCRKLLGPRYALLRPEFLGARRAMRERDGRVRRILIFFGGSDPTNETAKALEAVRLLNRPDIAAEVVVGWSNPHRSQIKALCSELPATTFHYQVTNMAELMARADLAIGAGGSTTWERSCLGLPALIMASAFNQEAIAKHFCQAGLGKYLGVSGNVNAKQIRLALEELLTHPDLVRTMGERAATLVDGQGVSRVLGQLYEISRTPTAKALN